MIDPSRISYITSHCFMIMIIIRIIHPNEKKEVATAMSRRIIRNFVIDSKAAHIFFLSFSLHLYFGHLDISSDRRTAVPVRHLPEDIYTEVCPYVAHPNSYGFVVTFIYYTSFTSSKH